MSDKCGIISPFSVATVVVANSYIDTFPHPQGLLAYLQRLFLQLDIEVISSDRPYTIKSSWRTICKMDAFLKTLLATIQKAISEGSVPDEADFNAVFAHFQEENNFWNDTVKTVKQKAYYDAKSVSQTQYIESPHSSPMPVSNFENKNEEVLVSSKPSKQIFRHIYTNPFDKWYFNSNFRGKTVDKTRRQQSCKSPPEPYVIVEAEEENKSTQPSVIEIEKALCQVYKKETIEKYHKKYANVDSGDDLCDKHDLDSRLNQNCVTKVKEVKDHRFNNSNTLVTEVDAESSFFIKHSSKSKINKMKQMEKLTVKKRLRKNEINDAERNNCAKTESYTSFNINRPDNERRQSLRQSYCEKNCRSSENGSEKLKIKTKLDAKEKTQLCINKKKSNRSPVKKTEREKPSKVGNREMCNTITEPNTSELLVVSPLKHELKESDNNNLLTQIQNKEISLENNLSQVNSDRIDAVHSKQGEDTTVNNPTSAVMYTCDQCLYQTSKPTQLVEHQRRVHLTKKFTCEICSKEFGFRKDLRRHMKCHTKAENCCDVCGKLYKEVRQLVDHKKSHAEDYIKPEFPCKFCSKIFSTKYVLAYHIKSNHLGMKRSYMCPSCGKSFSQKKSYLQHANVHLGIRPFVCEICGKKFSYVKSLNQHKYMHKAEKLFSCKICDKSFRQSSGLATHMKVHKASKDYVCSMCGKGFSQRQAMTRHERIHIGEKPYECGLCKRAFADSSVLRRHMIQIHKKDPKMWREDTISHHLKKTDFYINILNNDNTDTSELNIVNLEVASEFTQVQPQNIEQVTDTSEQISPSDHHQQLQDYQRDVEHYITVSMVSGVIATEAAIEEERVYTNPHDASEEYNPFHEINALTNVQSQVLQTECNLSAVNQSPLMNAPVYPSSQFTIQDSLVSCALQNINPLKTQPTDAKPQHQLASKQAVLTHNTFVPIGYTHSHFSYNPNRLIHQSHSMDSNPQ